MENFKLEDFPTGTIVTNGMVGGYIRRNMATLKNMQDELYKNYPTYDYIVSGYGEKQAIAKTNKTHTVATIPSNAKLSDWQTDIKTNIDSINTMYQYLVANCPTTEQIEKSIIGNDYDATVDGNWCSANYNTDVATKTYSNDSQENYTVTVSGFGGYARKIRLDVTPSYDKSTYYYANVSLKFNDGSTLSHTYKCFEKQGNNISGGDGKTFYFEVPQSATSKNTITFTIGITYSGLDADNACIRGTGNFVAYVLKQHYIKDTYPMSTTWSTDFDDNHTNGITFARFLAYLNTNFSTLIANIGALKDFCPTTVELEKTNLCKYTTDAVKTIIFTQPTIRSADEIIQESFGYEMIAPVDTQKSTKTLNEIEKNRGTWKNFCYFQDGDNLSIMPYRLSSYSDTKLSTFLDYFLDSDLYCFDGKTEVVKGINKGNDGYYSIDLNLYVLNGNQEDTGRIYTLPESQLGATATIVPRNIGSLMQYVSFNKYILWQYLYSNERKLLFSKISHVTVTDLGGYIGEISFNMPANIYVNSSSGDTTNNIYAEIEISVNGTLLSKMTVGQDSVTVYGDNTPIWIGDGIKTKCGLEVYYEYPGVKSYDISGIEKRGSVDVTLGVNVYGWTSKNRTNTQEYGSVFKIPSAWSFTVNKRQYIID